jgi:hypothetical protein
LPFSRYFGRAGKVAEVDGDLVLSHFDALDEDLDDLALLFESELPPPAVQILGARENLIPRDELDLHEVDFALEPGKLALDLGQPLFEGAVGPPESVWRDLVGHVQSVETVHLAPDLRFLPPEALQGLFLAPKDLV